MCDYLIVFGTRPEAIKLAPLVLELSKVADVKTCVTGQHRDMLDQVLDAFSLKPDVDLNIMRQNQSLNDVVAETIRGMDAVLRKLSPKRVIVQGDTATTFAAGLAAFYCNIPVAHVEAGLRTFDLYSPWPEELNRQMTTLIADIHFAPTQLAAEHLKNAGVADSNIVVTGNTVIDALRMMGESIDAATSDIKSLTLLQDMVDATKKTILVTGHRRESFGAGFANICQALSRLAERDDIQIIYPVHLNPSVRAPVERILSKHKNILLLEPLGYREFTYLLKKSYVVLTDSGGVQEEAPAFAKPVFVLREKTERQEAIAAGSAKLVGTSIERIVLEVSHVLDCEQAYSEMAFAHEQFGDGRAVQKIIHHLLSTVSNGTGGQTLQLGS